jgi:hypothetical protein
MKLSKLSRKLKEKIKLCHWDRIIEKHEGPEDWQYEIKRSDVEFMEISGHHVLLPVGKDQHPNITILRCIEGDGGQSLTIFLKDTTYIRDPDDEMFFAGFVAVCDKFPGEDFFIAILFHEWFIIEEPLKPALS